MRGRDAAAGNSRLPLAQPAHGEAPRNEARAIPDTLTVPRPVDAVPSVMLAVPAYAPPSATVSVPVPEGPISTGLAAAFKIALSPIVKNPVAPGTLPSVKSPVTVPPVNVNRPVCPATEPTKSPVPLKTYGSQPALA